VDVWNGQRGEIWERAQRLHDKMQTNLSMAKDRLNFLGNLYFFEIFDHFQMLHPKLSPPSFSFIIFDFYSKFYFLFGDFFLV
jgi:hypothetical protein